MLNDIEKLQNMQNNIKVILSVTIGILWLVYFFTFAQFIDHGYYTMIWVELISSVVFVICLIKINWVSFTLLKLVLRHTKRYSKIINAINYSDIGLSAQDLNDRLSQ